MPSNQKEYHKKYWKKKGGLEARRAYYRKYFATKRGKELLRRQEVFNHYERNINQELDSIVNSADKIRAWSRGMRLLKGVA